MKRAYRARALEVPGPGLAGPWEGPLELGFVSLELYRAYSRLYRIRFLQLLQTIRLKQSTRRDLHNAFLRQKSVQKNLVWKFLAEKSKIPQPMDSWGARKERKVVVYVIYDTLYIA